MFCFNCCGNSKLISILGIVKDWKPVVHKLNYINFRHFSNFNKLDKFRSYYQLTCSQRSFSVSYLHNYEYWKSRFILIDYHRNKAIPDFHSSYISTRASHTNTESSSIFAYISKSTPVAYSQDLIIKFHDSSNLPWWASIILMTFILRMSLTLPLAVYQNYIMAKVENITVLQMPEFAKVIKKETASKAKQFNWTNQEASLNYRKAVKRQWDTLIVNENCHPFKATITLWFQIPTWIFFSTALRNLAYMLPHRDTAAQIIFLQFAVGGFLWIPNLTQPDGTLILPLVLGLSNLAIVEIQAMMRLREPTRFQKYVTNFFRCFSIAMIPISATIPSSVTLYWTTSSLLGLGQNLFLMSPRVRTWFHIPDTPSTLENPYLQLLHEIKQKGRFSKKMK